MAPTPRQLDEQARVREKILAAARDMFVTQGFEAVSLRKIAESIGYTAPALYTHFRDKADILSEICRQDFDSLAEHFNRLAKIESPVERIYQIGMTYIRFAKAYPNHYRLMFMTPDLSRLAPPTEEDLQHFDDPDHDAYAFLRRAVSEAMERGLFRAGLDDADLLTQTLWAGVHGVAAIEVTHSHCPWLELSPLDRRAETICEAVLRGLLSEAAVREFNP
jgi:AcrR family transcriptional regulator